MCIVLAPWHISALYTCRKVNYTAWCSVLYTWKCHDENIFNAWCVCARGLYSTHFCVCVCVCVCPAFAAFNHQLCYNGDFCNGRVQHCQHEHFYYVLRLVCVPGLTKVYAFPTLIFKSSFSLLTFLSVVRAMARARIEPAL